MRVLVATDAIDALSSARAGAALASGWAGAETSVLPVGDAGAGFVAATADRRGSTLVSGMAGDVLVLSTRAAGEVAVGVQTPHPSDGPIPYAASSAPLGQALVDALGASLTGRMAVDLTGLDVHDGGAGLLGALGATADVALDRGVSGLTGISELDLSSLRARFAGVDLFGVVSRAERDRLLLGLRGITSLRGRAAGADAAVLLGTDAALEAYARLAAPEHLHTPGAGAAGGIGLAVLALGGRLAVGPELAFGTLPPDPVDLVVTGCRTFDFATRGGGVVAEAARFAAARLCPCIVLAGEVLIGGREMRTMGVEAAYALRESSSGASSPGAVLAADLTELASRVARSWTW